MIYKIGCALIGALVLSGCTSLGPGPSQIAPSFQQGYQPVYYISNENLSANIDNKKFRDTYIFQGIRDIGLNYLVFKSALRKEDVAGNILSDGVQFLIGLLGTLETSVDTLQNMHALSAAITGAKAIIDKNVFFEQAAPAIIAQMDAQMTQAEARLLKGASKALGDYPLITAYFDMRALYLASTIGGATGSIIAEAANTGAAADAKIRRLKFATSIIQLAIKEKVCLNEPCTEFNAAFLRKLAAQCAPEIGVDAAEIAVIITTEPDGSINNQKLTKCATSKGLLTIGD